MWTESKIRGIKSMLRGSLTIRTIRFISDTSQQFNWHFVLLCFQGALYLGMNFQTFRKRVKHTVEVRAVQQQKSNTDFVRQSHLVMVKDFVFSSKKLGLFSICTSSVLLFLKVTPFFVICFQIYQRVFRNRFKVLHSFCGYCLVYYLKRLSSCT